MKGLKKPNKGNNIYKEKLNCTSIECQAWDVE